MPGETFITICGCTAAPGTVAPSIAPYVVSIGGLQGIVTLGNTGAIVWSTIGNTIYADLSASAGLGSVTSVNATSPNSNLTITGGPITTLGSLTFDFAGNLDSISGLVMAADQMIYSTAADTFAVTSLTAFARTLLDDAAAVTARSTLGLVIGTNVQAWSSDLDRFVTDWSFSVSDWTLTGTLTITSDLTANGVITFPDVVTIGDALSVGNGLTVTGTTISTAFSGDGSALTALNASTLSSGAVSVARGGTNITSYTVGDLLYASGATTLSKLADVAAGSFLRSGGVATAPAWSTLVLPNAATVGDIFSSSSTNTMSRITAVATGNALISGGVATLPSWGKITTAHTTGIAASGANNDITSFAQDIQFTGSIIDFSASISALSQILDGSADPGNSGDILTSTGTGVDWSNQIGLDTLNIVTSLSMEATMTAGGVTGNQTINKLAGSVNIAAGGSSITVTNSLCTANTIVMCAIATNDTTAILKNVVASSGQFVIRTTAAVTAETKITFVLVEPS